MPRYFFDVLRSDRKVRDQIGLDLSHVDRVWPEIAQLVHDHLLASAPLGSRIFDVTVRDEAGTIVVRSTTSPPFTD